jgi:PIN domain
MRLYLDLCCLKRPYDNQSDERVRLETVALETVLRLCQVGVHELLWSDPLRVESADDPNPKRQAVVEYVRNAAVLAVDHSPAVEQRAVAWNNAGVRLLDALHLASAEVGQADYFCTCDDSLSKRAVRLPSPVRMVSLSTSFRNS